MRITNLKDVRAAVWAGIGYLNAHKPGWRRKIDLERLDLESGDCCVLGEVYGEFGKGTASLGLTLAEAEQLGFFIPRGVSSTPGVCDAGLIQKTAYKRLTAEWRAAYRAGQRKAARA